VTLDVRHEKTYLFITSALGAYPDQSNCGTPFCTKNHNGSANANIIFDIL